MKSEMLAVFREISLELKAIRATLDDPRNGLAAIRLKVDAVTDDHDEALRLHAKRLSELERRGSNGAADAE